MTAKNKFKNRVISVIVSLALIFSMMPMAIFGAYADSAVTDRLADTATIDQWQAYFPVGDNLTTQNAGGIWSDKSVFTENTVIDGQSFTINGDRNFLVALSAIGSNMTVTGMGAVPTDIMFVLDVSGSMADQNNDAAESLVNATNASITTLLESNPNNRVGVVFYSGPSSAGSGNLESGTVILPLASYKTDDDEKRFLNYSNSGGNVNYSSETVSVNENVYIEVEDESAPNGIRKEYVATDSSSKSVVGGTYIQAGLALAEDEFLKADTNVTAEGMSTMKRMPAIVLMSDGAVSLATNEFHNPGNSVMGTGQEQYTTYDMGFVTQLTASHTKYKVSQHYGTDCLFYTLGMINPDNRFTSTNMNPNQITAHRVLLKNVAHGVLDPENTAKKANPNLDVDNANLVKRWNEYKETPALGTYYLSSYDEIGVLRVDDAELEKMPMGYVTKFFDANNYVSGTSGSLSDALTGAFQDIIKEISLQAVYHPTLVENGTADLSGYTSFVDKLGKYMKAADVKGIMTGGTLFTGQKLAKAFYDAFANGGGDLGAAMGEGSVLGVAFMDALTARLNIDRAEAFKLLQNAWRSKDISYTNDTTYSNSFGWVSNSTGAYIQPWNETDNGFGTNYHILPQNAAYVNRSYVFLGTEGNTDMMYATVRVREKVVNGVLTGEQEVNFAIPASLLPTITYNVDLNEKGETTNITVEEDTPIHLVYEVGLDPEINKFNVRDKVSAEYIEANKDSSGNIMFYTNEWERDGSTGYNKQNTYSYFRPSHQNDRYYYQNDSLVYADANGNKYVGATHPYEVQNSTFYYYYTYYAKTGNSFATKGEYHTVPRDVLQVAVASGENTWTLKAGTVRSDYADADAAEITKADNASGTLSFSHEPFADANGYAYDDTSHSSVVGVTLANNGRYVLEPDTGIRITKSLATSAASTTDKFTFEVSYAQQAGDLEAFAYRYVGEELIGSLETVEFRGGVATVELLAGETLYIGGMTDGEVTVTEKTSFDWVVQTVSVDGTPELGSSATVMLAAGDMRDIEFVNAERGKGILNIAKSVTFPTGVNEAAIVQKTFTATVNLQWNGEPLANYKIYKSAALNEENLYDTTDGDGNLVLDNKLYHGAQITLYGIPEGTVATVVEDTAAQNWPAGFSKTPVYWENGVRKENGTNAVVEITPTAIADVMVRNTYEPNEISTSFEIDLTKNFFVDNLGTKEKAPIGQDNEYVFKFTLQSLDNDTDKWIDIDTQTLTFTDATEYYQYINDFGAGATEATYTKAGIYRYRIVEEIGTYNHVIYDSRTHSFGVEITDRDADGVWEIYQARTSSDSSAVSIVLLQDKVDVDVTFDNEYNGEVATEAVIEIQKTVNDPSGVIYKAQNRELAEGFEFTVWDKNTNQQVGTAQSTNTGGITRFNILYKASDVNETFNYIIKESKPANPATAPGWSWAEDMYVTVKITEVSGDMRAIAYLDNAAGNLAEPADATNMVEVPFVNAYTPEVAELELDFVSKQLNGRVFNGDVFEFSIQGVNGSVIYASDGVTALQDNELKGTATANSGNKAQVSFADALYFGKVGTYYYAISETTRSGAGITSDDTVYRVTVTVTDDMAGKLNAAYTVTSVGGNDITFVNTYEAQPTALAISGTKTLTGREMNVNDFQFVLTPIGDNIIHSVQYAANGEVVTAEGISTSRFSFPSLSYAEAGTYKYKVTEYIPSGAEQGVYRGVTYSAAEFEVEVTVTDNFNGTLSATYKVDGSEQKAIEFANTYTPTPINVPINAIKDMIGRGMIESDRFTFELYNAEYDERTNTWSKGTLEDSVNNIGGAVHFKPIKIEKAGVYRFMVSEKEDDAGGITYDTTTWRVAIVVTDDNNGTLTAQTYYANDNGRQNSIQFLNRYSVADDFTEIEGKKLLENLELQAEQFEFTLYETDSTFAVRENTLKAASAKNAADGTFKLKLEYTKADVGKIFYYVLQENNAGRKINGITHSSNMYQITVEVKDNFDGTMKISKTVMLGGRAAEKIEFKNIYEASTSVDVNISKKVENKGSESITAEGFEFLLEKIGTDEKIKVTSDAQGKVRIPLEFNQADIGNTYSYKLTEIAGNRAHVTYSTAEYSFTVEITRDDENRLVATVMQAEKAVDSVNAEFVNIYDYTPPTVPKTGDTSNIGIWAALMFISGSGIIGTVLYGKRRKEESEE